MKILDVGCHDGYIADWLTRQRDYITHIDGIELHHECAAIAAERIQRAGISGTVAIGMAEDAPEVFEPGTYDAVVAFEIIEHVKDVDMFLDAMEAMVRDDGRVYISTPDGTFGMGQNPNHLRVYRSIDLAETLRRRGELQQMAVGQDGIIFASYKPNFAKSRGEVAIFTGGAWEPWAPTDIELKGLGGSETAAVRLAKALGEIGYTVTVYGEVAQGCYGNVVFRHWTVFDPTEPRACVISSRIPDVFDRPINAPSRLLWMHDTDCADRLTPERAASMTGIFTLSAWHATHVLNTYPFLFGKVEVTGNAIEPDYFLPTRDFSGKQKQVIYSSSPDRGLDLLMKAWPKVKSQVPDAELVYCYSSVYDAVADQQPHVAKFRDEIKALEADLHERYGKDTVRSLGSLSQPSLAKEMMRSMVWVAPSFNSVFGVPFHETYCIGAVESAAAGCYRVGGSWGALVERDLDWYVTPDEDGKPDEDMLVEGIVKGLSGDVVQPREWAMQTTWSNVAGDFDTLIQRDSPS